MGGPWVEDQLPPETPLAPTRRPGRPRVLPRPLAPGVTVCLDADCGWTTDGPGASEAGRQHTRATGHVTVTAPGAVRVPAPEAGE